MFSFSAAAKSFLGLICTILSYGFFISDIIKVALNGLNLEVTY